jgi:hypothetical protein
MSDMRPNESAHRQWYGAQQNNHDQNYQQNHYQQQQPPPLRSQGWAPYPAVPMAGRAARRRRRCDLLYSILHHVSPIVPFIMIVITAYVYVRDVDFGLRDDPGPNDPAWLPLYVVIPLSVANICWSFAVMITQRRAVHRGRPISQGAALAVEVILAAGGVVCFALLIAYIGDRMSGRGDNANYFPLSYEGAIAWLLGVQMCV